MSTNKITVSADGNNITVATNAPQGLPFSGGDMTGDINMAGNFILNEPNITELLKPSATVIPVFSTADLPTAVGGIIELTTNDVRYQIFCLIDLGTDRILSSAARIQIEGMTPDAGFLYTGTGDLILTASTVQLDNINLIGMSATSLINAANSGLNTLLCKSIGFIGGPNTDLVCIDNYDNVLFELCGFISGNRGICLANAVTNFTLLLCQFQIGIVGINIDFGTSLCAAAAIETCVSELSATSTFINAATNNGNITTTGGGTITHNKIDDSEVGSVISVGLSALDLRWTIIGNNNIVASDRLNPTGWAFYNDGDTVVQTAPSGEGNAIQFSVDGLGVNTNSNFAPRVIRGTSEMWNTTTDEFIPITLGDSFNARIAFTLTGKGANPNLLTVVFDIGSGAGITIPIYKASISTPNTFPQTITLNAPVFALDTFLANNGRVFMYTDSGTLDMEERQILIQRVSSGAS